MTLIRGIRRNTESTEHGDTGPGTEDAAMPSGSSSLPFQLRLQCRGLLEINLAFPLSLASSFENFYHRNEFCISASLTGLELPFLHWLLFL